MFILSILQVREQGYEFAIFNAKDAIGKGKVIGILKTTDSNSV